MFSLKTTCNAGSDGEPRNLRAMYRLASILSHDCTPNTKHTFDPDYGVNIYATVPIGNRTVFILDNMYLKNFQQLQHQMAAYLGEKKQFF